MHQGKDALVQGEKKESMDGKDRYLKGRGKGKGTTGLFARGKKKILGRPGSTVRKKKLFGFEESMMTEERKEGREEMKVGNCGVIGGKKKRKREETT